jgi:hypothetical protein
MTFIFLAAATAMLTVALLLIFAPLLRANYGTLRRLRESRAELRALDEARSTGSLGATDYASRRAALGLAAAVLVPLAALGMYRWLGSPAIFRRCPPRRRPVMPTRYS